MAVNAISPLDAGSLVQAYRDALAAPRPAQPALVAEDPFGAYLLSLSAPATGLPLPPDPGEAQADQGPATMPTPDLAVADTAGDVANQRLAGTLADQAEAADQAGIQAGEAATNAFYAASAEAGVTQDAGGLAIDATAKFMGAGAPAQPSGPSADQARALAAYLATLNGIPAVSGVPAPPALAANTSSTPQGRAFAQPAPARQAPRIPAAAASSGLDLLG